MEVEVQDADFDHVVVVVVTGERLFPEKLLANWHSQKPAKGATAGKRCRAPGELRSY
jgi:hypothetical protein